MSDKAWYAIASAIASALLAGLAGNGIGFNHAAQQNQGRLDEATSMQAEAIVLMGYHFRDQIEECQAEAACLRLGGEPAECSP